MTIKQVGGILAGALVVGYGIFYAGQRQGVANERASQIAKRIAPDLKVVRRTDSILVRDTIKLRTVLHHFDTVRVTLAETLTVHLPGQRDTQIVFIPRSVADTIAATCSRLLNDCGDRVRASNKLAADSDSLLKARLAQEPGFLRTYGVRALWGLAGAGAGRLTCPR